MTLVLSCAVASHAPCPPLELPTRWGVAISHMSYTFLLAAFVLLLQFLTTKGETLQQDAHMKVRSALLMVFVWAVWLAAAHTTTYYGQVFNLALT